MQQRHTRSSSSPRRGRTRPGDSTMQRAFLDALVRRVDAHPSGTIVLPTGTADVAELAQVLRAINRARRQTNEAADGHD